MATKLETIKGEMGFQKAAPMCGNCKHFSCEQETREGLYGEFTVDKMMRCGLGNFKVGKSNWCQKHERKELQN